MKALCVYLVIMACGLFATVRMAETLAYTLKAGGL
jgi:hypothetical protein